MPIVREAQHSLTEGPRVPQTLLSRASCQCGPERDDRQIQAVVGMLTADEKRISHARSSLTLVPEVLLRFVVRAAACQATNGTDVFIVPSDGLLGLSAQASRAIGPIVSATNWLACAYKTWPNARFIGKADDDVFVDFPLLSQSLRQTPDDAVWGRFERYRWDEDRETPVAFGSRQPCTATEANFSFPFPKGPLFLFPRHLVPYALHNSTEDAARIWEVWQDAPTNRLVPCASHGALQPWSSRRPSESLQRPRRARGRRGRLLLVQTVQERRCRLLDGRRGEACGRGLLYRGADFTRRQRHALSDPCSTRGRTGPGYSGFGNCTVVWHSKAMLEPPPPHMRLGMNLNAWKAQNPCRANWEPRVQTHESTCHGTLVTHLAVGGMSQEDFVSSDVLAASETRRSE